MQGREIPKNDPARFLYAANGDKIYYTSTTENAEQAIEPTKPRRSFWKKAVFWEACQGVGAVAMAFVTIYLAHYAVMQWQAMQDTLKEARRQSQAAVDAAKAAQQAADIAQAQLRPWISINKVSIERPLTFSAVGATIGTRATLKNVGSSPALNVYFRTKLVFFATSRGLSEQQKGFCDPFRKREARERLYTGSVIFPGEELLSGEFTGATQPEVENALKVTGIEGMLSPSLIVCVDYLAHADSTTHHQTGYVFPLGRPKPGGVAWVGFFKPFGSPPGVIVIPASMGQYAD